LKYFKYLFIYLFILYIIVFNKKNYNYYNKSSKSYILVNFLALIFIKANIISDFLLFIVVEPRYSNSRYSNILSNIIRL
jgi:hypothetical protein